jgi:hypothetical protein
MIRQKRIIIRYPIFHSVVIVFLLFLFSGVVDAQTMYGIRVGDHLSSTSKIGLAPVVEEETGPFVIRKWRFSDTNELSVTAFRNTGKIIYMETNWNGDRRGALSDIPGMIYGKTTLSDMRKQFGSNGFSYEERGSVVTVRDGIIMINSYQIMGTNHVITFITKISEKNISRADKAKNVADLAFLDTIIIGDTAYLDTVWGKAKIFDKQYKPIKLIQK